MSDVQPRPIAVLPKGEQRSILVHGLLVFAVTGGLAVAAGSKVIMKGGYAPSAAVSVPYVLMLFLLVTLLMILALKSIKRPAILEALFSFAMLSGAWFLADIYFSPGLALIVGSAVILMRFVWKSALAMNVSLAVGIAGIAASVASGLSPNAVLILLTVLSFYDIVAVYRTRHMVKMFRGLASRGVVLAFVLTPLSHLLDSAEEPPASRGMYLGTGDVALPAMLAAAALRVGPGPAVTSIAGAAVGFALMFMLFLAQPKRAPIPALPPIALGAVLAYLISLLIFPS